MTTLPPLSLYIHIPWCVRKCPYCDFNSHELRAQKADPSRSSVLSPQSFASRLSPLVSLTAGKYLEALLADLDQEMPQINGRCLHSLFIGGGTPSLLSPDTVDGVLSGVGARLPSPPEIEVTLEANPGTVDMAKLAGFRVAGVNRLSIGVQSFQGDLLARIGRIHGKEEAIAAFEAARRAGFENINLDLMFGLPGESVVQAIEDIETAVALGAEHLSFYQLTLEPNTWFHRYPPELPEDDAIWEMQTRCQERLAAHGYEQYEVSAYARPGYRCHHNLNYWLFGDYLGIGAGAHGKITLGDRIVRRWKLKQPDAYMKAASGSRRIGGEHKVAPTDAAFEFMLNALRLTDGFPARLFFERTGLPIGVVEETLREGQAKGLISWDEDRIRPTAFGSKYLNELLVMFLPPAAARGDDVIA